MCDLASASYRHGAVIESLYEDGKTKPLLVSQARLVGLAIQDSLSEYVDVAKEIAASVVSDFGPKIGFENAEVVSDVTKGLSSRFDPGLILDLPKILLTSGERSIELRTCITVCVGPTKSKVWTRANTMTGWNKISVGDLNVLHQMFDVACRRINEILIEKYQFDFSSALDMNVRLEQYGLINVFAADCIGSGVSANIEQLCDKLIAKPKAATSIENDELAGAMRYVTDIAAVDEARDASEGSEFVLSKKAKFYPYRGTNGAGSVFVRYSTKKEAFFSGIVNGDLSVNSHLPSDMPYPGNSVGTTAEIAAFFGAAF